MTLDEAIKHAEEVAEENEKVALYKPIDFCVTDEIEKCTKCAEEHRQLAEWLKELKQLREQTRWIPVDERLPENDEVVLGTNSSNDLFETNIWDDCGETKWYANGCFDVPVIAWMPLPKPYEEK